MTELNKSKHFNVYVDEAGKTSYYNDAQPVVLWAGVITDNKHSEFDNCTKSLLKRFKLNEDIEIHASHLWGGSAPFDELSKKERDELFYEFIKIGIEFINYYHDAHDLKPFRRTEERKKLEDRNLTPLLSQLNFFMTSLDFYFEYELKADYSIFFDSSSDFKKTTKKLILELRKPSRKHYYLQRLIGEPMQIDSNNNRFIQLSDAIGYIIVRQAQLEPKTFKKRDRLLKHMGFIEKCYNTIISKKIPFVKAIACSPDEYKNWGDDRIESKNRMCDCWNNRDFKHLGRWLPKKNYPDEFMYDVNTFWEKKNEEILLLKNDMEKKLGSLSTLNSKNTDKVSSKLFGEILIEVFSQIKEIIIDKYKQYSDLPGLKALISNLDEYIQTAVEKHEVNPVNPKDTTSDANEIAESILRQAKFIPDSDEVIINQLGNKIVINVIIRIYATMKTINDNLNKCGTLPDEIKKFLESDLTKYSAMIQKCILDLRTLLENEIPSIKASDDAFRFNISYQRNFMKKYLKKFEIYLYSLGKKLDSFREILKWYRFSNRNLSKTTNIAIQSHDNLKIIMNELSLNLKDYITRIN